MNKSNNDSSELVNTLQIKTSFEQFQNRKYVSIGSTEYDKFIVVNPKMSTSQSWNNISQEIGNNRFTFTNYVDRTDDDYPTLVRGTIKYNGTDPVNINTGAITTYAEAFANIPQAVYTDSSYWEIGTINGSTGQPVPINPLFPRIRTKDFIKIDTGFDLAAWIDISSSNNGFFISYYNSAFGFVGTTGGITNTFVYSAPSNPLQVRYIKLVVGFINNLPIDPSDIQDFSLKVISGYAYNSPPGTNYSNEIRAVSSIVWNPYNTLFTIGTAPLFYGYQCVLDGSGLPAGSIAIGGAYSYNKGGNFLHLAETLLLPSTTGSAFFDVDNTDIMILEVTQAATAGGYQPLTLDLASVYLNIPSTLSFNYDLVTTSVNPLFRRTIIIPDGYYSGITSTPTQAGYDNILAIFSSVLLNSGIDITLQSPPSYKIDITCSFPVGLFFSSASDPVNSSLTTTEDTSAPILGWPNKTTYVMLNGTVSGFTNTSPNNFDLYTDGRFYACNINLSLFGTTGFVGESNSLITFYARSQYGSEISENDISYSKILPPNSGSIQNLTLTLTDSNDKPISLADRVFVRFEIQCYRTNRVKYYN